MASLSSILRLPEYWSGKLVVRWPLVISLTALWVVGTWLRSEYGEEDSTLWLVMNQFVRLLQWTIIALFTLSTLITISAWTYFLYGVKNHRVGFQAQFGDGQKAEAGFVPVEVTITGIVIRPPLGTVRAQLLFEGMKVSDPLILDVNMYNRKSWWRQGIRGTGRTMLHDRGIYDVKQIRIMFCDMFGLIGLPFTVPYTRQLFTLPKSMEKSTIEAQPQSTEEQKHRITIPRRVEGEYVNYKQFEPGDNIQRIVWKIYAKSGQLVVRIPEIKDPYASHLYFYVSFFEGMGEPSGAFETELLNVYKDRVRNLFEALQRNGYDVRIPQDQEVPKLAGLGDKKNELFQITAANWQKVQPPMAYVKPSKAAFVCLSSLVRTEDVETLLRQLPESVPVVMVRMSGAIASPFKIKMKDIFFRPESQPGDRLRQPWLISSLRRELLKNEKTMEGILKTRGNAWLADSIEAER